MDQFAPLLGAGYLRTGWIGIAVLVFVLIMRFMALRRGGKRE